MDSATRKKYAYWEWRTIIILMIGYVLFYFVRKNFSIAIPAMEQELGLSKAQLGIFLTINGIIYGLSRFVNGILVDRFSRKMIMGIGLLLSAAVNLVICFSSQMNGFMDLLDTEGKATMGLIYLIGSLWLINGYVQGMGVPPCVSLMVRWIKPSELATKQSIWNASHSIGAGIVVFLCGWMLQEWGYSAWNLCFAIPAIISLVGVPLIIWGLKDNPEDIGLPSLEQRVAEDEADEALKKGIAVKAEAAEADNAKNGKVEAPKEMAPELFKRIINKMVFCNPYIWILSVTNFCIYVIRFTILDWGSSFLTQDKGMDIDVAASVVGVSELVGGIIGMLVAGWVTDRWFRNKAHRTCFFCTLFATLAFAAFWLSSNVWVCVAFIVVSAFFIYGPQALLGVCASQQCTKYATGTGNGILGIFGYASTAVSGVVFGIIADSMGWNSVYLCGIIFGVVGTIVIGLMWKAPADGYEHVNRIISEFEEKK